MIRFKKNKMEKRIATATAVAALATTKGNPKQQMKKTRNQTAQ